MRGTILSYDENSGLISGHVIPPRQAQRQFVDRPRRRTPHQPDDRAFDHPHR